MMVDWNEPDFPSFGEKIPVGRTISAAYGFAFGGFFGVLGAIWLPFVLFIGVVVLFPAVTHGDITIAAQSKPSLSAGDAALLFVFYAAVILFMFIQVSGALKQALGLRKGPKFLYLTFDKSLILLIAAFFIVILIGIAVTAGILALIGGIGAAIKATGGSVSTTPDAKIGLAIAIFMVMAVFICTLLYVTMRGLFLLPPVIIAEQRLGILRTWRLGKDNFWRMFAIYLSVVAPIAIAELIFFSLLRIFGPSTSGANASGAVGDALSLLTEGYAIYLIPVYLGFTALTYGLFCGAQAFAYRALVPAEKAEDVF